MAPTWIAFAHQLYRFCWLSHVPFPNSPDSPNWLPWLHFLVAMFHQTGAQDSCGNLGEKSERVPSLLWELSDCRTIAQNWRREHGKTRLTLRPKKIEQFEISGCLFFFSIFAGCYSISWSQTMVSCKVSLKPIHEKHIWKLHIRKP